jgi:ABC-type uncharacterized transport system substrate-binding protein
VKRREFIGLLGGAAAWPIGANAQHAGKLPTVGFLAAGTGSDPVWRDWTAAFVQRLRELGWIEGRTVAIEYRWAEARGERFADIASELVRLKVDVIVSSGSAAVAVKRATSVIPIVFPTANEPVGSGLVETLARPGGNATGFIQFEYSLSGKWLELLKQVAPGVTRAAVLRDPVQTAGVGQFAVIQSVASSVGIEVVPVNVRDADEIERAVTAFARVPNGGMVVTASALTLVHLDRIVTLAAKLRLPAVYPRRLYVDSGGLISYGFDVVDQFRRAASYIDRILKGEKPADLPVQAPTKYELVVNLKTAKAIGLTVPDTVLARADEVIE